MTLIAGVDFNTRHIDAALIPIDETAHNTPPVTLRRAQLRAVKGNHVERLRSVRRAVHLLLGPVIPPPEPPGSSWMLRIGGYEITSVWVEEPIGQYRTADRPLNQLFGAIIASIPPGTASASLRTIDWRRELGLPVKLDKPSAIIEARRHVPAETPLDEHEAEALLIAIAARKLMWAEFDQCVAALKAARA